MWWLPVVLMLVGVMGRATAGSEGFLGEVEGL